MHEYIGYQSIRDVPRRTKLFGVILPLDSHTYNVQFIQEAKANSRLLTANERKSKIKFNLRGKKPRTELLFDKSATKDHKMEKPL